MGADVSVNFPFGLVADEATIRLNNASPATTVSFADADFDGITGGVLESDGVNTLAGAVNYIAAANGTIVSSSGTLTIDPAGGDAVAGGGSTVTFEIDKILGTFTETWDDLFIWVAVLFMIGFVWQTERIRGYVKFYKNEHKN